ncbi:MAG: hypothetical protein IKP75_02975 [Oscillospiraceae bacterium]|nr:hypothetical protein [Oscillospiraceae bacterium]
MHKFFRFDAHAEKGLLLCAVLLAGCGIAENGNAVTQEVLPDSVSVISGSTIISDVEQNNSTSGLTKADGKNSTDLYTEYVPSVSDEIFSSVASLSDVTSVTPVQMDTVSVYSSEIDTLNEFTDADTNQTEALYETIPETAYSMELFEPKILLDKWDNREYIIVSIIPEKIYWNELDLPVSIGNSVDVFLPAELYNVISEADEVVIWFTDEERYLHELHSDGLDKYNILRGIKTYSTGYVWDPDRMSFNTDSVWNSDRMCLISDDSLFFYDKTKLEGMVWNGILTNYLADMTFQYNGRALIWQEGMTTDEVDDYFMSIYNAAQLGLEHKKDAAMQGIIETDSVDSEFFTLLGGTRLRARISFVY